MGKIHGVLSRIRKWWTNREYYSCLPISYLHNCAWLAFCGKILCGVKQTRLIPIGFCLINKVLYSWLYQNVPEIFQHSHSISCWLCLSLKNNTSMAHGIAYLNYSQTLTVFWSQLSIINLLIVLDKNTMHEVNVISKCAWNVFTIFNQYLPNCAWQKYFSNIRCVRWINMIYIQLNCVWQILCDWTSLFSTTKGLYSQFYLMIIS